VVERIHAITEGNPLFVEELLAMLIDEELVKQTDEGWEAVGDLSSLSIPATIDALLTARVDRLPIRERGVLQSAAVIGRVFYPQAVGRLVGESREEISAVLVRLVSGSFVVEDPTEFLGETAMRFRHALIQESSYASTPKRSRAKLHEAFGAWLEEVLGERITEFEEIVGYHLERAYRYRVELRTITPTERALATRAATYLESAGRRAHARGDIRAATSLLSRAVELAAQTGSVPSSLLSRLAMALAEAGRLDEGENAARESVRRAADAGDDVAAAFARVVLSRIDLNRNGAGESLAGELFEAIQVLERAGAHEELAQAFIVLYLVFLVRCRMADAEAALLRAAAEAKQGGDGQAEAVALAYLAGSSAYGPKPTSSCIRFCEEILRESGDNPLVSAGALAGLARLYAMVDRFADARRSADDAFRILDDLGWDQVRTTVEIELALFVGIPGGDRAGVEADLQRTLKTLRERGEEAQVPDACAVLARCAYAGGRYREAEELAREAAELSDPADVISATLAVGVHAMALARCGEPERAEQLARGAVEGIASTDALPFHAQAMMDLGEVLQVRGTFDEAIPVFRQALTLYERKGNLVGAAAAREQLSILSGR
jgi:tetratricopeptide (TPR) repeat protein